MDHDLIPILVHGTIGAFNDHLKGANICQVCAYNELILSLIATGVSNGIVDPNILNEKIAEVIEAVPAHHSANSPTPPTKH